MIIIIKIRKSFTLIYINYTKYHHDDQKYNNQIDEDYDVQEVINSLSDFHAKIKC